MNLYVEGGGDRDDLKARCREGFQRFFDRAGVAKKPRVVACGGIEQVLDRFSSALGRGEDAALLVDSEGPVRSSASEHLRQQRKWAPPRGCNEDRLHLVVQCLESWLLVDRAACEQFFGRDYDTRKMPPPERTQRIEEISVSGAAQALREATRTTQKGAYSKGSHSFQLLGQIDPGKVTAVSPWARRFLDWLRSR